MRECLYHRKRPRQSIKKRVSIVFVSDRKWEAMSEREIGKGETPFCSITVLNIKPSLRSKNHRMLTQRFCVLKLANGIMLQIVLYL